jgi:CBS domain-containing protein
MKARDVMTWGFVSVEADASVERAARLMLQNKISGLPVVVAKGTLVGIVTEGDFLRRAEIGTQRRRLRAGLTIRALSEELPCSRAERRFDGTSASALDQAGIELAMFCLDPPNIVSEVIQLGFHLARRNPLHFGPMLFRL